MAFKFHVVNASPAYYSLFKALGGTIAPTIREADLIVFTGGSDVSPSMYGCPAHSTTHAIMSRDLAEKDLYEYTLKLGKKMVGICRGAQFLNVMNGGILYQDVTEHCGDHVLKDIRTGKEVLVSSTHHQMMKPSANAITIALAHHKHMREWFEPDGTFHAEMSKEGIEAVFYPSTQSLCFQPHPEFNADRYAEMKNYFKSLLEDFLGLS